MAAKRITMQDIADACGLSRNTVSKVFNARGSVPELTRRLILDTAERMGYRQLPDVDAAPAPTGSSVALFTRHMPSRSHYGSQFVSAFANRLSRSGHTLMMYEILPEEQANRRLPSHFDRERTVGILGIELFDRPYSDFVCSLGLPTIFADTYARADFSAAQADIISMENTNSSIAVVAHLLAQGAGTVGFVGDKDHCNSFYERWNGYRTALARGGSRLDPVLCILAEDGAPYADAAWLVAQLDKMPALPDAFFCANDFLAIHLVEALRLRGLTVPGDIMVAGFDGSSESTVIQPHLTTVAIPSAEMGYIAAGILLDRLETPSLPYRSTYIQTVPLFRASTRAGEG